MHAARVLRQRHKQAAEAGALQEDGSLCAEQRRALEEAFEAADKNGDGVLSAEEYHEIFAAHGLSIGEPYRIFHVVLKYVMGVREGEYKNKKL